MTYGDLTFHQYCEKIDAVTSSQVNAVASKCLAGKPTLLVHKAEDRAGSGPETVHVPIGQPCPMQFLKVPFQMV